MLRGMAGLTSLLQKVCIFILAALKSIKVSPGTVKCLIFLIRLSKAELDQATSQQELTPSSLDQSSLIFFEIHFYSLVTNWKVD